MSYSLGNVLLQTVVTAGGTIKQRFRLLTHAGQPDDGGAVMNVLPLNPLNGGELLPAGPDLYALHHAAASAVSSALNAGPSTTPWNGSIGNPNILTWGQQCTNLWIQNNTGGSTSGPIGTAIVYAAWGVTALTPPRQATAGDTKIFDQDSLSRLTQFDWVALYCPTATVINGTTEGLVVYGGTNGWDPS